MWSKMNATGKGRLALLLAGLFLAGSAAMTAEPDKLAKARAAAKKALEEEQTFQNEWNSREMARSATREIAVSARNTADRALQNVLTAQEALKEKVAAAKAAREALAAEKDANRKKALEKALEKAAAEVAFVQKQIAARIVTMRTAAERMFTDQRVANQATDDLIVIEKGLAQKMNTTRDAERVVLTLEMEAAKVQGVEEKKKNGKAPAIQTAADKAKAAERALREAEVVKALEDQAWWGVHASTYQQMASGNANAADIATRMLGVESEAARKKALQAFIAKVTAAKAEQEKKAAEHTKIQRGKDWNIYLLRNLVFGGLKPLAPEAWDYAKARHLLVRAGFGGTPQEVARLHALGLFRAVEYLVEFHQQPAANVPFDAAPLSQPDPLENKVRNDFVRSQVAAARRGGEGAQSGRLRLWWMRRLVESPRPLQEKLTLFWHGHFATQYSVVQNSYTTYHQNQLFREHAAGNFGGLLTGLVHDPVMIRYLDNNTNVKGHANENLAREIMELFAMGVDKGYTEKDIREAARALTGYTFDHFTGQFRFLIKFHDEKPKTIFGKTGTWTGDDLVQLLLEHPSTARFIAFKLFEYFAHNSPGPEVVDRLATVLRENKYELAPMLQNIFLSEEFYSERAVGTQIKSPIQLVAGMLRDLGAQNVADYGLLYGAARDMGQDLLEPPDVKGWRGGRSWVNSNRVFLRYNTIANLVRNVPLTNGRRGIDVVALVQQGGCKNEADVVAYLAKGCFIKPLDEQKRQELLQYLGTLPPCTQWAAQRALVNDKLQGLLTLMLSTPEYQMM